MQVRDGIEIARGLFLPESAIEIAADARVVGIARELADVIDVIDHGLERGLRALFITGDVALPVRIEHPRIECRADDPTACDYRLDHLICQLPLTGRECAAVVVTRRDRAVVIIEDFPKCLIGSMRQIHDDARGFERVEQGLAPVQQPAFGAGAVAIGTHAIMRQAHHSQAQIAPFGDAIRIENRIRAFHRQHQADRRICRGMCPCRDTSVQIRNRVNLPNDPAPFHRPIKREMPHSNAITLRLIPHARARPAVLLVDARHHRAKHNPHMAFVQLGKRGRTRPKTARGRV